MTRDHIIQEIRRTAKENGGYPLGRQKFSKLTGIKEGDWRGKYWARWGDAVQEAGYAPNMFQDAYDKEELLEKLITLIRELGRIPVDAELRMKHRDDFTFPSHSVFRDHFGSKKQLVEKILEYCESRKSFEDIVSLCKDFLGDKKAVASEKARLSGDDIVGFVYLLKSGRFYKIGKTKAVGRREYELAIQLPEKPRRVHVIKTDDPTGIEAYWHKRFSAKRKQGEWFDLDNADVAAFKRRDFM